MLRFVPTWGRQELASEWRLNSIRIVAAQNPNSWRDMYLESLRRLASNYGLHRLTNLSDPSDRLFGAGLIHRWVSRHFEAALDGREYPASRLVEALGMSGLSKPEEDAGAAGVISLDWQPHWDSTKESYERATARLRREAILLITRELRRIRQVAIDNGLIAEVPEHEERDVRWMFWKLALGMSYEAIAARSNRGTREFVDKYAVRNALVRMSDLMGINRDRWGVRKSR